MQIMGYDVQYGLQEKDIDRFVQYANRRNIKRDDEAVTREMIEALIRRSDYKPKAHIILLKGNRIIGDTMVQVDVNRYEDKSPESHIGIHIDPEYFNKALFSRLLRESLEFTKRHGNKTVSIFNLGERRKLALLKKSGFKEIQREYLLKAKLSSKPYEVKLRPGYTIRGFRKEDTTTYIELLSQVADERGVARPPPGVIKTLFETAISPLNIFIAEHDGRMIGGAIGFWNSTQDRKGGEFAQIFVVKDERRKGVERALRNTVFNCLVAHGMEYVITRCFAERRLTRFNREIGYRTTGIRITLRKEL